MGKPRQRCKDCGRRADGVVIISKRGLCPECGVARIIANNRAMAQKEGPQWDFAYDRWLTGMAQKGVNAVNQHRHDMANAHLPPSG